jgi:hypothetical protein
VSKHTGIGQCSQCGQGFDDPACGPTHAVVWFEWLQRAEECVSACTGLADPAAEIEAMREVCEAAAQVRSEIETSDCVANGERSHQELARSLDSLAALKAPTSHGAGEGGGNGK